jgi:tungstate transport system substrate-binding protein
VAQHAQVLSLLTVLTCVTALPLQVRAAEPKSLLLATTTSVQDSGLLSALLPGFTEQSGIEVQVVAVGTGAALRMGQEGNADVLLTHAPPAEQKLVDSGAVDRRIEIMENYFVLAGPASDHVGVAKKDNILDALRAIRDAGAPYVSRADDSGTNKMELSLFAAAGLPADARWPAMTRTGSGMGLSLQVAGQREAYILSDIGTFLAFREKIGLVALSREEDPLRNVYSILRVSAQAHPRVRTSNADRLIEFIQSEPTRKRIAAFGLDKFGRALFTPLDSNRATPASRDR